jgi:hypothetical protein
MVISWLPSLSPFAAARPDLMQIILSEAAAQFRTQNNISAGGLLVKPDRLLPKASVFSNPLFQVSATALEVPVSKQAKSD